MISLNNFTVDYLNEDEENYMHIIQSHDPRTGKIFSSWEEVCDYLATFDLDKKSKHIVDEAIVWFEENEIKPTDNLFANRLSELKEKKREEIKAEKIATLSKGLLYKEKHFQYDADGKSTILSVRLGIIDGSIKEFPIAFKTYENVYVELTEEEFIDMSNKAVQFETHCLLVKDNCLKQIDNAKTLTELSSVKFDF